MKLFFDEMISHRLARDFNARGTYDVVHPLNIGMSGAPDHAVAQRCLADDRVLVTQNARDFRGLAAKAELHPGIIALPNVGTAETERLLLHAIAEMGRDGEFAAVMVNRFVEVDTSGRLVVESISALTPAT